MADLKENAAADAIEEAVRRKTVGIVYGSGESKWRGIGSGTLIAWKGQRFVLTADHVISETSPADLRFFLPSASPPKKAERDELFRLIGVDTAGLNPFAELPIIALHRDGPNPCFAVENNVASPSIPSWNQIVGFLESMRRLRDSSGFAA